MKVIMEPRAWHVHMARVYLAQAMHARRYPQHSAWHAKCLAWAADYRRKAAACGRQPLQGELFGQETDRERMD